MAKGIPHIEFDASTKKDFGFDIVSIETIYKNKEDFKHDPEVPHQLKFYNLIFFTEGKGKHFVDFNWYHVQQNSLVYLTKEQVHAFQFSKNLKGYCVIFTEGFFIKCFSHLPEKFVFRLFNPQLFSSIIQIPKESDFIEYFHLLKKEYSKSNTFNKNAILESLLTVLISKAEHIKQDQTFHIKNASKIITFQKFTNLIEANFHKSRHAAFYAEKLAITYKHLNTICKDLVNKTAKLVIDDFIILQAKRNLINSNLKSSQLAYKMGFEDPTNFTKYFKKHTTFTPKAFKKHLSII